MTRTEIVNGPRVRFERDAKDAKDAKVQENIRLREELGLELVRDLEADLDELTEACRETDLPVIKIEYLLREKSPA